MAAFVPYCGTPPTPLSVHWNYAPVLMIGLVTAPLALHLLTYGDPRRRALPFAIGWGLVAACYLSPLCNLGVALFSARAAQHVALVLVAAPLMAAGWRFDPGRGSFARMAVANLAFLATIWAWHSPWLYDETLRNNYAYWAMNAMMVGSAIWFWRATFAAGGLGALAGVSFGGLQMCALGAIIAFAADPLYSVHAGTTLPWGLSQIEDQHLGGLIMWVPAGVVGAGYSAVALWLWLRSLDARHGPASALALRSAPAVEAQP